MDLRDEAHDAQPCPCCRNVTKLYAFQAGPRIVWNGCLNCSQNLFDFIPFLQAKLDELEDLRKQQKPTNEEISPG